MIVDESGRMYITIEEAPRETLVKIVRNLDLISPGEREKLAAWARGDKEYIYLNPQYLPGQAE
jgi:hypothetical protein